MRRDAAILLATMCAALAGAPAPAGAQPAQALEAARKAGSARDAGAMQALVARRDGPGLSAFVHGYASTATNRTDPIPEGIEAVVVASLAEPLLGGTLVSILDFGHYRSRALFDVLLAATRDRLVAGRVTPVLRGSGRFLVKTSQPGIEPPVHTLLVQGCAMLPAGQPKYRDALHECPAIAAFLAARRHEPTREWLVGQLSGMPASSMQAGWLVRTIAGFRDAKSAAVLVERLAVAARPASDPAVPERARDILDAMLAIDPSVPLDYLALRRALSEVPRTRTIAPVSRLIASRRDARGVDTLVDFLDLPADGTWYLSQVTSALEALNSPEAWRVARAHLKDIASAEPLNPAQREALKTLDRLLEAKAPAAAPVAQPAPPAAAERSRAQADPLGEARRIAASNPEEAARLYGRYIDEKKARLASDAAKQGTYPYQGLGHAILEAAGHDRYFRRNPRAAVERVRSLVKLASDMPGKPWPAMLHWRIADILHFDLGDRAGAAREMAAEAAKARAQARTAKEDERISHQGLAEWMEAEAAWLREGRVMRGRPSDAVRSDLGLMMMFGADLQVPPALRELAGEEESYRLHSGAASRYPALLRKALGELPASRQNVFLAFRWLGLLDDEAAMRRFLERHDPAGVATLVMLEAFASIDRKEVCADSRGPREMVGFCVDLSKPSAAQEAAARILASRGHPGPAAADPRLASPQATWNTFLGALRVGDAALALECLTSTKREDFRGLFQKRDAASMRRMADSFTGFSLGESMGQFQEAWVTRDRGGEKRAGAVHFLRQGRNWRIDEM